MNERSLAQIIEKLQQAAHECDWDSCLSLTSQLIERTQTTYTLRLILELAEQFLSLVRPENFTLKWIVEFYAEISNFILGKTLDVSMKKYEIGFDFPGGDNFAYSLILLGRFFSDSQQDRTSEIEIMTKVVANIIVAHLDFEWAKDNPELWQKWYATRIVTSSETSVADVPRDKLEYRANFWIEPAVQNACAQKWFQIATYYSSFLEPGT